MEITIKNLQTKIPIRLPRIKNTAQRALRRLKISSATLSFVFVTPQKMKALNSKYLKHHYVTDVLTFDFSVHSPQSTVHRPLTVDRGLWT